MWVLRSLVYVGLSPHPTAYGGWGNRSVEHRKIVLAVMIIAPLGFSRSCHGLHLRQLQTLMGSQSLGHNNYSNGTHSFNSLPLYFVLFPYLSLFLQTSFTVHIFITCIVMLESESICATVKGVVGCPGALGSASSAPIRLTPIPRPRELQPEELHAFTPNAYKLPLRTA